MHHLGSPVVTHIQARDMSKPILKSRGEGESQISAYSVKSCATLGGAKTLPCTVRKSDELIV